MAKIVFALSNLHSVVEKIRLQEYDMLNDAQIVQVSQVIIVTTP